MSGGEVRWGLGLGPQMAGPTCSSLKAQHDDVHALAARLQQN
uniref:Uncharacterized protein n=1 Tax=Anguilla anguilla TaxID=7936 RepID=A0A0E9VMY0_ANGAN